MVINNKDGVLAPDLRVRDSLRSDFQLWQSMLREIEEILMGDPERVPGAHMATFVELAECLIPIFPRIHNLNVSASIRFWRALAEISQAELTRREREARTREIRE